MTVRLKFKKKNCFFYFYIEILWNRCYFKPKFM